MRKYLKIANFIFYFHLIAYVCCVFAVTPVYYELAKMQKYYVYQGKLPTISRPRIKMKDALN